MWTLSGRLREVVAYKNQTTEVSYQKSSQGTYFKEDNFFYYMQFLSYDMLSLKVLCTLLVV